MDSILIDEEIPSFIGNIVWIKNGIVCKYSYPKGYREKKLLNKNKQKIVKKILKNTESEYLIDKKSKKVLGFNEGYWATWDILSRKVLKCGCITNCSTYRWGKKKHCNLYFSGDKFVVIYNDDELYIYGLNIDMIESDEPHIIKKKHICIEYPAAQQSVDVSPNCKYLVISTSNDEEDEYKDKNRDRGYDIEVYNIDTTKKIKSYEIDCLHIHAPIVASSNTVFQHIDNDNSCRLLWRSFTYEEDENDFDVGFNNIVFKKKNINANAYYDQYCEEYTHLLEDLQLHLIYNKRNIIIGDMGRDVCNKQLEFTQDGKNLLLLRKNKIYIIDCQNVSGVFGDKNLYYIPNSDTTNFTII